MSALSQPCHSKALQHESPNFAHNLRCGLSAQEHAAIAALLVEKATLVYEKYLAHRYRSHSSIVAELFDARSALHALNTKFVCTLDQETMTIFEPSAETKELYACAVAGDVSGTAKAITRGADATFANLLGRCCLVQEVSHAQFIVLLQALIAGASLRCNAGAMLRMLALDNKVEYFRLLLTAGWDPNYAHAHEHPLAAVALAKKPVKFVRLLLDFGCRTMDFLPFQQPLDTSRYWAALAHRADMTASSFNLVRKAAYARKVSRNARAIMLLLRHGAQLPDLKTMRKVGINIHAVLVALKKEAWNRRRAAIVSFTVSWAAMSS
jgi:hypothetical protein